MSLVFAETLVEASQKGLLAVFEVYLREIKDLPFNLLREYMKEILTMKNTHLASPPAWPVGWGTICFGGALIVAKVVSDLIQFEFFPELLEFNSLWFPWGELGLYALAGCGGFLIGHLVGILSRTILMIIILAFTSDMAGLMTLPLVLVMDLVMITALTGLLVSGMQKEWKWGVRSALSGILAVSVGGLIGFGLLLGAWQVVGQGNGALSIIQAVQVLGINTIAGLLGGAVLGWSGGRCWPAMPQTNS